jgi:hypothetical protein
MSNSLSCKLTNSIEPFRSRGSACLDRAYDTVPDRLQANKTQNIPLEADEAMGHKVPTVDEGRHTHGDDYTDGFPCEPARHQGSLAYSSMAKPGRKACSKKPLRSAGMAPSHRG